MESIHTRQLHRTLYATRNGQRIAVHISRDRSQHGYYGSASLFGKSYSSWGRFPSHSFAKILKQLVWAIDEAVVKNPNREAISLTLTGSALHNHSVAMMED
ncbi:MAG: hypothetical protein IPL32_02780 [Chloracidobacterium sp.]|nr:hypothetical protein [Chloracidobacterium sp.]